MPIVVGGGVKLADIPLVKSTGVDGFFVVSAVCGADDPEAAHENWCALGVLVSFGGLYMAGIQ